MEIRFLPAGDCALVAEFGDAIDPSINEKVHALSAWITDKRIAGVQELLPTFRSLTIIYDKRVTSFGKLKKIIRTANLQKSSTGQENRIVREIPCCYGGAFGPDLPDMEKLLGLSKEEIIQIHAGTEYKVYMLGFLPGFVYLGGLDKRIECPRLSSPRTKIPAGSVGIGGNQTGVYPLDSPGGWRLMGKTPVKFYDPNRDDPILCKAGEYIRFVPISLAEYEKLEGGGCL